jgi:hypothetical protein
MAFPTVRAGMAIAGAIATVALNACGGGGLAAASSCRDFMNASATEQHEIVDKLASEYNKPAYATPLGEPEVPFYCSSQPSITLGQFFQKAED